MASQEHVKMLILQKEKLNNKIHNEEKRPLPDIGLLHKLKWKRLKIDDEIGHFQL